MGWEGILVPRAHDPFGLRQGSILVADQKDRGLWAWEWVRVGIYPNRCYGCVDSGTMSRIHPTEDA